MVGPELKANIAGHTSCLLVHVNVGRYSSSRNNPRCPSSDLANSIAAIQANVTWFVLDVLTEAVCVLCELSLF
jgi:hypothetical protein